MILPDVNVLIYAFNTGAPRYDEFRDWLQGVIAGPSHFGVSELVLSAVVRIITNTKAFPDPITMEEALRYVETIRTAETATILSPGPKHWGIFADLCRRAGIRGGMVSDAYLAALAIEHGCEFITADRDFARFPGLKWRHPLEP